MREAIVALENRLSTVRDERARNRAALDDALKREETYARMEAELTGALEMLGARAPEGERHAD